MNRLAIALLCVLIVVVIAHGVLDWRAAKIAHEDAERQACIQRAEATAVIALLAPTKEVDAAGRLRAMATLGGQVDGC